MQEILPISAGVVVGLLCWRISSPRRRAVALVLLSVIFGFLASLLTGELALTWGFLLIDIPLVLLVALGTTLLVSAVRRVRRPAAP